MAGPGPGGRPWQSAPHPNYVRDPTNYTPSGKPRRIRKVKIQLSEDEIAILSCLLDGGKQPLEEILASLGCEADEFRSLARRIRRKGLVKKSGGLILAEKYEITRKGIGALKWVLDGSKSGCLIVLVAVGLTLIGSSVILAKML